MGTAEKKEGVKPAAPAAAHQQTASAPVERAKKGGHNPGPDGCHAHGCKAKAHLFNFCDEHYDWFKFGLIKKTGEHVSDFEKKFGHYQALAARKHVQKAA
jgi:hypothetical protein